MFITEYRLRSVLGQMTLFLSHFQFSKDFLWCTSVENAGNSWDFQKPQHLGATQTV